MKTIGVLCLAVAMGGCATKSRYASDPRARYVGPAYLDRIEQHPPDEDTQYFYPVFAIKGGNYFAEAPLTPFDPQIQALLTVRPEPTGAVKAITGKGWPKLESKGMPFAYGPQQ